jgi:hypothetical protein
MINACEQDQLLIECCTCETACENSIESVFKETVEGETKNNSTKNHVCRLTPVRPEREHQILYYNNQSVGIHFDSTNSSNGFWSPAFCTSRGFLVLPSSEHRSGEKVLSLSGSGG